MTRKGQSAERRIARRTPGRPPRRSLRSGRQRSPGRWAALRADVGVRANMVHIDAVSIEAPRGSDAWYVALMQHRFPGSFLPFGAELSSPA